MKRWTEILVVGAITGIVALALFFTARYEQNHAAQGEGTYSNFMAAPAPDNIAKNDLAYSDFVGHVDRKEVRDVTIQGHSITGDLTDGKTFQTYAPDDPALIGRLTAHSVRVSITDSGPTVLRTFFSAWLPFPFLIAASLYLMQHTRSGGHVQPGFGRSRARLITEPGRRFTFDDVAGIDEAREELGEIVEFLKYPGKFRSLGGKIPKGCLLVGPPGTGKTLLARAIAGEANVPFFTVSGSDFVEMYVGVGASRVRDMFAEAKSKAPCIIFIDEIDAVGRCRGAGLGGGSDEREQTLNQLLVEMDGFESSEGVIVLAATNRPDVLDPALLRPGRFDRQVFVPNPDLAGRTKILKVHLRKVPTAADVDATLVARGTPGFSGAELANLVNEAALRAARTGERCVTMHDLETAKEKLLLGPERRSIAMTAEDRRRTAYHESGHALVACYVPGNDPLHTVTIIPHSKALGLTLTLPEHDRHGLSRQEIEARIAMMFGGRVAEELIYGVDGVTTGAADDIRKATALARRMVTEFGFSNKLGPLRYVERDEDALFGQSVTQHKTISEATAIMIDQEIRSIIRKGETTARSLLTTHLAELHRLADALLKRETVSGTELLTLLEATRADLHNTGVTAA